MLCAFTTLSAGQGFGQLLGWGSWTVVVMPPYALEQGFLSKLAHYKISRRKEKAEWLPVQEVSQLRGAWILVPFYNSIGQCNIMWCIHAFCPSSSIKFQFGPPKSKGLGTSAPERHHLTSSFAPSSLFTMAATGCCPWIVKRWLSGTNYWSCCPSGECMQPTSKESSWCRWPLREDRAQNVYVFI